MLTFFPQFAIQLITKLLIFEVELHKHPVLSLSVCAQVAQARALKEIILSMILRNGKTIRLCVRIFMIVMFAHFFGLIEVILVILVSSLGLVFISLISRTDNVTLKPTTYWQPHLQQNQPIMSSYYTTKRWMS